MVNVRIQYAWTDLLPRRERVVLLTFVMACLNLWDLSMTLAACRAGAMFEANPVALCVLEQFGELGIALFKATLVTMSVLGFLIARRTSFAEIGCCAVILIYLAVTAAWAWYPDPGFGQF